MGKRTMTPRDLINNPRYQKILKIMMGRTRITFTLDDVWKALEKPNRSNLFRDLKALVRAGWVDVIPSDSREGKRYRISPHFGSISIEAIIQKMQRAHARLFEPISSTLVLSQIGNLYGQKKDSLDVEIPTWLIEDTLTLRSNYDLLNISTFFELMKDLIICIEEDQGRPKNLRLATIKRIYRGCKLMMDHVFEEYRNVVELDESLSLKMEKGLMGIRETAMEIFQKNKLDLDQEKFFKVSKKKMVTYMMDLGLHRDLTSGLPPPTIAIISSPEYWIQDVNPVTGWDLFISDMDYRDEVSNEG